jgi:hypothetical protein
MVGRLNFVDFVWAAKVRLGELVMVAILNLTGFRQTDAVRLKLDSTGWAAVRLRFDSFEWAVAGL